MTSAGQARVVRQGGLPIASGENLRTLWEFKQLIVAGGVTYPEPDVTNCGGITGFMKIAHLAEAFNLPVTSHGAHDVTVHLLAAVPNRSYLEAHGFGLDRFIAEPIRIEDGIRHRSGPAGAWDHVRLGRIGTFAELSSGREGDLAVELGGDRHAHAAAPGLDDLHENGVGPEAGGHFAGRAALGQDAAHDQLASAPRDPVQDEAGPAVEAERGFVVGRDEEADLPAGRELPQLGHDSGDGAGAAAAALAPTVDAEPAEPPACVVAAIGMDGEEADQVAALFDADHLMRTAAADRLDDIGDRPEEPFDLVGSELEPSDAIQLARGEPAEGERRSASGGNMGPCKLLRGQSSRPIIRMGAARRL